MNSDKEKIAFLEAALQEALEELRGTYYFETMFPQGDIGFASGGRSRPPASFSKKVNREE